jgi:hypothetical protein
MEPVSGVVQSVTLTPGRPDYIHVLFEGETGSGHPMNASSTPLTGPEFGEVYCDGQRSDATDLFDFLIVSKYPVKATLYPDGNHYGNAMKAEFTSKES